MVSHPRHLGRGPPIHPDDAWPNRLHTRVQGDPGSPIEPAHAQAGHGPRGNSGPRKRIPDDVVGSPLPFMWPLFGPQRLRVEYAILFGSDGENLARGMHDHPFGCLSPYVNSQQALLQLPSSGG